MGSEKPQSLKCSNSALLTSVPETNNNSIAQAEFDGDSKLELVAADLPTACPC